jgi:hypothetical protein
MSKWVYRAIKFKAELPTDIRRRTTRVRLAKLFGWTLDYIDDLLDNDPFTVADIFGIEDGERRAQQAPKPAKRLSRKGRHRTVRR